MERPLEAREEDNCQTLPDFTSLLTGLEEMGDTQMSDDLKNSISNLSFKKMSNSTQTMRMIRGRGQTSPPGKEVPKENSKDGLIHSETFKKGNGSNSLNLEDQISDLGLTEQPISSESQTLVDLKGPSPKRNIDPVNKALLQIGKIFDKQVIDQFKVLLRRTSSVDKPYITIPDAEMEDIESGIDLVKSLSHRLPEEMEMIDLLKCLCAEIEKPHLIEQINDIVKDVQRCESYPTYDQLDDDDNSLVVVNLEERLQKKHWRSLTSIKKVSYHEEEAAIIFSRRSDEDETWESTKIPKAVWKLVLQKREEIERIYETGRTRSESLKLHIAGNTYVSISTYTPTPSKTIYLIHLRKFVGKKNGNIDPTKTGISLTLEKWKLFIDYLAETLIRLDLEESKTYTKTVE